MATHRNRASHVPEAWALPRFTRIVTFTGAVLDVFSEALRLTDEAEKRYPLVEG
jgi:hypothetical protein